MFFRLIKYFCLFYSPEEIERERKKKQFRGKLIFLQWVEMYLKLWILHYNYEFYEPSFKFPKLHQEMEIKKLHAINFPAMRCTVVILSFFTSHFSHLTFFLLFFFAVKCNFISSSHSRAHQQLLTMKTCVKCQQWD